MNFIERLFSSDGFMPHGHCYLWDSSLVWLHVISDSLITLAYFTIPVTLIYILRKRKDLPFNWMFACFGVFILACGATHALEVWTLWHPTYWVSGMMKAITAAASVATAILLVKLIPQLLAIPGLDDLREANAALVKEAAERRRAEEALRKSEEQLRFTLESTDVGEWEMDLNRSTSRRSLRHDQIFGYDHLLPEWNYELFIQKHLHPDDLSRFESAFHAGSKAGQTWESEYRIRRLDGEERFVWVKGSTHEDGGTLRMSGLIMDITQRRRADNEIQLRAAQVGAVALLGQLALARESLSSLFDQAVTLVAGVTGTGYSDILELQPDGQSLLLRAGVGWKDGQVGHAIKGVNKDSQSGYTLLTGQPVIVEDLSSEQRFHGSPLMHEHGIISGISVLIGLGSRPFGILGTHSTTRRTFTDDDVLFLQAVASLLAAAVERAQVEETLGKAKEAAERANATQSEFLSRMSHELRTPLSAILGFGQLLVTDGRNREDASNVEQILTAGQRLLVLVDELLAIARIEEHGADVANPAYPVSDAIEEGSSARETLPFTPRPPSAIPGINTVLYIEDNPSNLRLITRILARRPAIRLLSAATGARGLEMARELGPNLILLDLHLTGGRGEEVLAKLRADARTTEIPVVMLSADAAPGKCEEMLAAGARVFLPKPVYVPTLLAVLDQFIEFQTAEALS